VVTRRCEAPGTMKPQPKGWYRNREKTILLLASKQLGARIEWYGQHKRNPDKRRHAEQAKGADRLAPNGNRAGTGAICSPVVNDMALGGKGWTYPTLALGRNMISPYLSRLWESNS
jgi:hypothetical protein